MSLEAKDNAVLIGKNLFNLRRSREMTLGAVAGSCGLSVSFISQIEKGTRRAKPLDLKKILNAFGFPLSVFFSHVQNDISQFPLHPEKKTRKRDSFILMDGSRNGPYSIFLTMPVYEENDSITLELNLPPGFQTESLVILPSLISIYSVRNKCIIDNAKEEEFLAEGENLMAEGPAEMIFRNAAEEPSRVIINLSRAAF